MSDEREPTEYGLVMPFVVVQSVGGPYADDAFVAGCEYGFIDATLHAIARTAGTFERMVNPKLVPQLDLLAMHHGYAITSEPWDEPPENGVTT